METRDLIIETAFLAFIEHGYDRISLNKIIQQTGLTKGAFYHNFSSKNELIHDVIERYFFSHINKTIKVMTEMDGGIDFKLATIAKNIVNMDIELASFPDKEISYQDFMSLLYECMYRVEDLKSMVDEQQELTISAMTNIIEEGISVGILRDDLMPRDIAELLNATVRGSIDVTSSMPIEKREAQLQKNLTLLSKLIMNKSMS